MANPNTWNALTHTSKMADYRASLALGMLPITAYAEHPTIIYRWKMKHIIAPIQQSKMITKDGRHIGSNWRDGIWVEAWVWTLFHLKNGLDIFNNGFTSVQENKPRVQELKIFYDRAAKSPEERLIILTEFRLGLPEKHDPGLRIAADAAICLVRTELDELERNQCR